MVQEIVTVSIFQNLDLGKAATKINGIWHNLGLDHVKTYANLIKIFYVVQELWRVLRTTSAQSDQHLCCSLLR